MYTPSARNGTYTFTLRSTHTRDLTSFLSYRDAWFAQRGLSRTEAKRRYISTLIDTMHRYASQTPEARELVSELEFVWDQIKSNTSSSSSTSSPVNAVGVPPLTQPSYGSISGRLARSEYENLIAATARGDSRLRVLSPVSQPDDVYRRRGSNMDPGSGSHSQTREVDEDLDDDEEEEEEYAEAQDNIYADDDHDDTDDEHDHDHDQDHDGDQSDDHRAVSDHTSEPEGRQRSRGPPDNDRRWRRRVEQALTKMTAEIAAVREQMETRALAHRRRTSVWAWFKWLVWVSFRQIIWDLAILGMALIWMRLRGDRRLEHRLRVGWSALKSRVSRLKFLRRTPVHALV